MNAYLQEKEAVLEELASTEEGLTKAEAEKRLVQYGPNRLEEAKKDSFFKRLMKQLSDPMIIVLIADFGGVFDLIGEILIWISLALTIISLIDYIWKNRQVLTHGGM